MTSTPYAFVVGGQTSVITDSVASNAILINCTNVGGGVDINAGTSTGPVTIDAGGAITMTSALNNAQCLYLHANAGISETIHIHADQGTSITSIDIESDVGGVSLQSGLNAARAIYLHADAGTAETIHIRANQGQGVKSVDVTSDAGGISLTAGRDAIDAIVLEATAGGIDILASGAGIGEDIDIMATGSSVNIVATENVEDAIVLNATTGGINILASAAAAGEDIDIIATGSSVNITASESDGDAIVINASGTAGGIHLHSGTGGIHVRHGDSSFAASLHFREASANGALFVAMRSPADLTGTGLAWTLTLPVDDGTLGQTLQTDGTGVTSWGNTNQSNQSSFCAEPNAIGTGDVILTIANLLSGVLTRDMSGDQTWTMPTAAAVIAGLNAPVAVGACLHFYIINENGGGANDITLTATGGGLSPIVGNVEIVSAAVSSHTELSSGHFMLRVTNITNPNEAYTTYRLA